MAVSLTDQVLKKGDRHRGSEMDMLQEGLQEIMSAMLLPLAFFLFVRRVIGQVVLEKEKGLTEFMEMNGMNPMANYLAVVLHESLVNGPVICVTLDCLAKWRLREEDFRLGALLLFNLGIVLFLMGASALAILISKMFATPGFAQ
jgi:hypothetical protein